MPITPETDLRERNWQVDESRALINVHKGVAIPRLVRAWGPLSNVPLSPGDSDIDGGFRLEVEAAYSKPLGHYTLRSFSLVAQGDEEVNGVLLRTVTPLGVLRWILPRTFHLDASALSAPVMRFVAPELKPHRTTEPNGGSTSIKLTDVGTVYRLAAIVRQPPAKAVAETFGLQTRNATYWITRARALGLT